MSFNPFARKKPSELPLPETGTPEERHVPLYDGSTVYNGLDWYCTQYRRILKLCLAQESQKIVACLADKADETVACACGKKAHRNCPAVNAKVGRAGSGRHGNPAGFGHAKGR